MYTPNTWDEIVRLPKKQATKWPKVDDRLHRASWVSDCPEALPRRDSVFGGPGPLADWPAVATSLPVGEAMPTIVVGPSAVDIGAGGGEAVGSRPQWALLKIAHGNILLFSYIEM
jgi:hypothetical protein